MSESTRQPITFDNLAPPKLVTDPEGKGSQTRFPKTLYRHVTKAGEDTLVVAWHGRTPIYNEQAVVSDEAELEEKTKQGWSLKPEMSGKKAAA